jgi:hypothetical protein
MPPSLAKMLAEHRLASPYSGEDGFVFASSVGSPLAKRLRELERLAADGSLRSRSGHAPLPPALSQPAVSTISSLPVVASGDKTLLRFGHAYTADRTLSHGKGHDLLSTAFVAVAHGRVRHDYMNLIREDFA